MFKIPTVPTSQEILDSAFRRAKKASGRGRSPLEKAKSTSLARVDAFASVVRSRLQRVFKGFPSLDQLHPFYGELIDVIAGLDEIRMRLGSVHWAFQQVGEVTRQTRRAIKRGTTRGEVEKARKACYGRVSSIVKEVQASLEFLNGVRNDLRVLPHVDTALPTIVIAGAPNVGKSRLVRAMSSGRPKIASYPFTTLDLSLGHFEVEGQRFQVMDTPGLLDRPLEERNQAERKALAALRHLASAILFLLDPTETCGYTMVDQEGLLADLRQLFPETPLVDVENKADLLAGTGSHPRVSALTGKGLPRLVEKLLGVLTSPAPEAGPLREAG